MKKLLWLLLLPAVLAGWIMSFNPGCDQTRGDTLKYVRYSNNYEHFRSIDGILQVTEDGTAANISFYCAVPSPSIGYDTIVIIAKGAPTNTYFRLQLKVLDMRALKYWIWSQKEWKYYQSGTNQYVNVSTSWQKFSYPIKFPTAGFYRIILDPYGTPAEVDSYWVDSLYVKRHQEASYKIANFKRAGYLEQIGGTSYYSQKGNWETYEEQTLESKILLNRIVIQYHVIDTMSYPAGIWTQDDAYMSKLDNFIGYCYQHGISIAFMERYSYSSYHPKGMRFWTLSNGQKVPQHDDLMWHLSHLCSHLKTVMGDSIKPVFFVFMNELQIYFSNAGPADTLLTLWEDGRDTIHAYFPECKVTMGGIETVANEESADSVGKSYLEKEAGSFHVYGYFSTAGATWEDYRTTIMSSYLDRISSITYNDPSKWVFNYIDEFKPNIDDESDYSGYADFPQWLAFPGIIAYFLPQYMLVLGWIWHDYPTIDPTNDSFYPIYYAMKFIAPYIPANIYVAKRYNSHIPFVKLDNVILVANPYDHDTIEVQLPKAGIAKVRWLDPNTQFPIIRTENRSPIYEKTMCVGNRLTIPPGYMYAIEYLR